MTEENRKIMILNYDSEVTEKVKEIFSENCDVATSASLKDISEKADENFDIIITGYVVPAVSGDRTVSYLQNIQKALDEAKSAIQEKRDADETLMRETEEKQDNILEMLNDHVRRVENEIAELKTKMESMTEETDAARKSKEEAEKKSEAALKERAEAEKNAEEALKEKVRAEEEFDKIREDDVKAIDSLKKDVVTMREELEKSNSLLEQANAEKRVTEEKLTKLQENWENFVSGQ